MRSLKLLLFKPGFLTVEFIRGSRVKYLKPLQLFVIMNIIMFFTLSFTNSSIITTNFYMQTELVPYKSFTKNLISNENVKFYMTFEESATKFDTRLKDYSKSLIFIMLPLFAVVLKITNRKYFYAKHLVSSTHFFSFILFCIGVVSMAITVLASYLLGEQYRNSFFYGDQFFIPFFGTTFFIYQYFTLRRVYEDSKIFAVIKAIILVVLWLMVLTIYRFILFLIVYLSFKIF